MHLSFDGDNHHFFFRTSQDRGEESVDVLIVDGFTSNIFLESS